MLAGWREWYANEMPERTKMLWWRRMLKKMSERVEGLRAKGTREEGTRAKRNERGRDKGEFRRSDSMV